MNSNSREIRRLNSKSFFNRRCLRHCCRCCLSCFLLGSEHLPALSTMCLFGCLVCVCAFVCFALVCQKNYLPFIQLLLFKQCTSVFYLNSHYESWSFFACNQNINEDISTVLPCFETKRNTKWDLNWSSTKTSTQRASDIRGRTGYNV